MSSERRKAKREAPGRALCGLALCAVGFGLVAGCADHKKPTSRPAGAYERQEQALKDPFGYSPNVGGDSSTAPGNISGGKIGELDRDAMKKDIDHVLNP